MNLAAATELATNKTIVISSILVSPCIEHTLDTKEFRPAVAAVTGRNKKNLQTAP
jgi:hypothetical protein